MTIGLLTNIISPHQIPLASRLAKIIGKSKFRYIYTQGVHQERVKMGWCPRSDDVNFEVCLLNSDCRAWLENADFVYSSERDFDLIEARLRLGRPTFYMSERWFKPYNGLSGWLRLLSPSYFNMARRMAKLFDYPGFCYLPQGKWAERDMAFLCRVMGRTMPPEKVIPWGYFVAPSSLPPPPPRTSTSTHALRVLWVGRMIGWKRVDTIIRAVAEVAKSGTPIACTLVGSGPEESRLKKLASTLQLSTTTKPSPRPIFTFKDSLPIDQIRDEMRANDVYVLSSNGEEGWGAALNEAMEEGMLVLGTYEAGASSSMLPESNLFHAGEWKTLADMLRCPIDHIDIGEWSVERAAVRLMKIVEGM